jgi:uncharacterized protein with HEPN domain
MKDNSLGDAVRLRHILDAIKEVEGYLHNVSIEQFLSNSEKRFATIKQIEIIGEACNALTVEIKLSHTNVPWREIAAFRNVSIHEYFGLNFQLVWEIATNDLSILKPNIDHILRSLL